jgi:hypothetical protein
MSHRQVFGVEFEAGKAKARYAQTSEPSAHSATVETLEQAL